MARRAGRLWSDEEERSICFQAAAGVSVAQVARRYAMNADMVFEWLRDLRYAPEAGLAVEAGASDDPSFLPVEIVDRPRSEEHPAVAATTLAAGTIEIVGGHRLRILGCIRS